MSSRTGPGMQMLESLLDHEKRGVPDGAGTDSAKGFDLGPLRALLAELGHPERACKAVHISGTKGKGSTAAMLAAGLTASGYKTGCYSSPHVASLRERICTDGVSISPEDLEALLERCLPVVERVQAATGNALSHFEVLTAAALAHFAHQQMDVAVVEAGLGAMRDATNVFDPGNLLAGVIMPVARDHMGALGGSLATIAAAKAGVMKRGRPVVVAQQPEGAAVLDVLLDHAANLEAPVVHVADQIGMEALAGPGNRARLTIKGTLAAAAFDMQLGQNSVVTVGMEGPHQLENAATAATAAAVLKVQGGLDGITLENIAAGLTVAQLPGRFQRCRLRAEPEGPWVVLDGAHTPEAVAALCRTLRRAFPEPTPVALVLATAADKDLAGICRELGTLQPVVVLPTQVDVAGGRARATPPGTVMAAWEFNVKRTGRTIIQPSVRAAIETARRELGPVAVGAPPGVILVTGSLHAAGAVLNTVPLV